MININLLPPELKFKKIANKKSANLISLCLVIILIVIIVGILSKSLESTFIANLKNVKDNIDKNDALLADDQETKDLALFINDRMKTSEAIDKNRLLWSEVLLDLSNSVPTEVQFVNLASNTDKSPNFILQGNTTNERNIIKFKEKLEDSFFFKNVSFKSSSLGATTDLGNKLTFTLEFDIEQNRIDISKEEATK